MARCPMFIYSDVGNSAFRLESIYFLSDKQDQAIQRLYAKDLIRLQCCMASCFT